MPAQIRSALTYPDQRTSTARTFASKLCDQRSATHRRSLRQIGTRIAAAPLSVRGGRHREGHPHAPRARKRLAEGTPHGRRHGEPAENGGPIGGGNGKANTKAEALKPSSKQRNARPLRRWLPLVRGPRPNAASYRRWWMAHESGGRSKIKAKERRRGRAGTETRAHKAERRRRGAGRHAVCNDL